MAGGAFAMLRDARELPEAPNQLAAALAGIAFLVLAYVGYRDGYASAASVGIVQVLVVGAFLVATGLYLAGRRASFVSALRGLPLMAAGAGLDLSGAARFEAGWVGYEVFAAVLALAALAFLATGRQLALPAAAAVRETAR